MYGYTLVELLISLAIAAILAAIAIPSFNGYQARSQVAEAAGLLAGVKPRVREYHEMYGTYPTLSQMDATVSGAYTASIIQSEEGNCFTAIMKEKDVNHAIAGGTLRLCTPDSGVHWTCFVGGRNPIDTAYVPPACR